MVDTNKSVMNSNISFSSFEEMGDTSGNSIYLNEVWIDRIPDVCPTDFDENGIHYIDNRPVLEKLENVELSNVSGSSAFTSPQYTDVITSRTYIVTLYDANNVQIPYGLNDIVFYNDYVAFRKGIPSGFALPFKASFVKYIGRKADTSVIKNDGTVSMEKGYTPQNDLDIATKEYVDVHGSTIENLIPTLPPTLKDASLNLLTESFKANMITTGIPYNFIISDKEIVIESDPFYNTNSGTLELLINDFVYSRISIKDGDYDNSIIFIREIDSYSDDVVANGFYTSKIATIKLNYESFRAHVNDSNTVVNIKLKQKTVKGDEVSNTLTFAIEMPITKMSISSNGFDSGIFQSKFISGVPSLTAGSQLTYSFDVYGLNKSMNKPLGTITWYDTKTELVNEPTYMEASPTINLNKTFTIPDNYYSETIDLDLEVVNVFGEPTTKHISRPWRFDNISDETKRVMSGAGLYPSEFGGVYDSTVPLSLNEELQLLNGTYIWPKGDYTKTERMDLIKDSLSSVLPRGPNYDILDDKIRWVTFKENVTNVNGLFIKFNDLTGWTMDPVNKITNYKCLVQIKGVTGWLDVNTPYSGYGNPRNDGEGCMVIYKSDYNQKYATFGNVPLSGTAYIRIGFTKSKLSFSDIVVKQNNI